MKKGQPFWLFKPHQESSSWLQIIWWWESRRIHYNLAVLLAGLSILTGYSLLMVLVGRLHIGDLMDPLDFLFSPIFFNVCYTGGWITELILKKTKNAGPAAGPLILKIGLLVSVLLFFLMLPGLIIHPAPWPVRAPAL